MKANKKSPGEVYVSLLIDKKKMSVERNVMAAGLVDLYGRDSLYHVMSHSPLEKAVIVEMNRRGVMWVRREKYCGT